MSVRTRPRLNIGLETSFAVKRTVGTFGCPLLVEFRRLAKATIRECDWATFILVSNFP